MCVCTCKPGYETSLSDRQWAVIEPLLPARNPRHGGRALQYDRRLILDTILFVLRTGCAWRHVPHDLAPWDAAYRWFAAWSADGTWRRVHEALRDRAREAEGRDRQASAAGVGSPSTQSGGGGGGGGGGGAGAARGGCGPPGRRGGGGGGGRAATPPASGFAAANGTCW